MESTRDALSRFRTKLVQQTGLKYNDPIIVELTNIMDSMVVPVLSDPKEVNQLQAMLEKIRNHKKKFKADENNTQKRLRVE